MEHWDLFGQLVAMKHPALDENSKKLPVIVSKVDKGLVVWNLGYLSAQAQTGQGGSGFEYTPLDGGQLEFDKKENCWWYRMKTSGGEAWDYGFYLPDDEAKAWYDENKEYLASPDELQDKTTRYFDV